MPRTAPLAVATAPVRSPEIHLATPDNKVAPLETGGRRLTGFDGIAAFPHYLPGLGGPFPGFGEGYAITACRAQAHLPTLAGARPHEEPPGTALSFPVQV